jgi:ketosteroid isomerase-like protein
LSGGDPLDLAVRFHAAINSRGLAALGELMSEDHRFIDAAGGTVSGKADALAAWQAFFALFPDYRNLPQQHRVTGNQVAMTGASRCSNPAFAGPALWRALVRGGLVAEWQVYRDRPDIRVQLGLG